MLRAITLSEPPRDESSLEGALASLGPLLHVTDVVRAVARLASSGVLNLPVPAGGKTSLRYGALAAIAATDLSLARITEGHTDALAILAEARKSPLPGVYGVWAAEAADAPVRAERSPNGGWRLTGKKRYASGARELGRALVTATADDGKRLFDVTLGVERVQPIDDTWNAVGMEATGSVDVVFDGVEVPEVAEVGGPGFYLNRPGFWHGAVGVAACWYGGALGAHRMLRTRLATSATPINDHQLAHLGAVFAACDTMKASLDHAAREMDADPRDREHAARTRALVVRHVVEQGCQEVLTRVGRASGPGPLVFDRAHARRAADLIVYLRQHHAERDLADLGRATLEGTP